MIDGYGILTYTDGAKYTGEWKDGKKHGKVCTFARFGISFYVTLYFGL